MLITIYKNGIPIGEKEVSEETVKKCYDVAEFMANTGTASIYGIGPVFKLQRQLDEVTRERDQYKAALELADALRNRKTK